MLLVLLHRKICQVHTSAQIIDIKDKILLFQCIFTAIEFSAATNPVVLFRICVHCSRSIAFISKLRLFSSVVLFKNKK